MRKLILCLVAAFAVAFVPAAAQTDVSGEWEMTFETPQGPMNATMTLKQDGTDVTGSVSSPAGDLDVKGSVDGGNMTLSADFNGPQGAMTITMTAEVVGAAMKGDLDFGQGTASFFGKRK